MNWVQNLWWNVMCYSHLAFRFLAWVSIKMDIRFLILANIQPAYFHEDIWKMWRNLLQSTVNAQIRHTFIPFANFIFSLHSIICLFFFSWTFTTRAFCLTLLFFKPFSLSLCHLFFANFCKCLCLCLNKLYMTLHIYIFLSISTSFKHYFVFFTVGLSELISNTWGAYTLSLSGHIFLCFVIFIYSCLSLYPFYSQSIEWKVGTQFTFWVCK